MGSKVGIGTPNESPVASCDAATVGLSSRSASFGVSSCAGTSAPASSIGTSVARASAVVGAAVVDGPDGLSVSLLEFMKLNNAAGSEGKPCVVSGPDALGGLAGGVGGLADLEYVYL